MLTTVNTLSYFAYIPEYWNFACRTYVINSHPTRRL